jgi:hypothetical protein
MICSCGGETSLSLVMLYSWCSGRLSLLGFVLALEAWLLCYTVTPSFVTNKQGLETRTRESFVATPLAKVLFNFSNLWYVQSHPTP